MCDSRRDISGDMTSRAADVRARACLGVPLLNTSDCGSFDEQGVLSFGVCIGPLSQRRTARTSHLADAQQDGMRSDILGHHVWRLGTVAKYTTIVVFSRRARSRRLEPRGLDLAIISIPITNMLVMNSDLEFKWCRRTGDPRCSNDGEVHDIEMALPPRNSVKTMHC